MVGLLVPLFRFQLSGLVYSHLSLQLEMINPVAGGGGGWGARRFLLPEKAVQLYALLGCAQARSVRRVPTAVGLEPVASVQPVSCCELHVTLCMPPPRAPRDRTPPTASVEQVTDMP
jgi:hypothetical protein